MFNSNTWMILYYDMWPNVNMPRGIKKKYINILILSWQVPRQVHKYVYKPRLHTNLPIQVKKINRQVLLSQVKYLLIQVGTQVGRYIGQPRWVGQIKYLPRQVNKQVGKVCTLKMCIFFFFFWVDFFYQFIPCAQIYLCEIG